MKPLTVKDLMHECVRQVDKGNGNKVIMISSDDEGNSYHYLWYNFTTIEDMEEPIMMGNKEYKESFNFCDEDIAKKENTIILG